MLSLEILLVCLLTFITYLFITSTKRPKNYPPGPFPYPIFGHMFFMDKNDPLSTLSKLSKKYGKVFSLKLGSNEQVVIHDYHVAKQILNHPDAQGRPDMWTFKYLTEGKRAGITVADGALWQEHRRFALRNLRDFGFGKTSVESIVNSSFQDIEQMVKDTKGKPFYIPFSLNVAVLNVIWNFVAGKKRDIKDPKFVEMYQNLDKIAEAMISFIPDMLPWLLDIFPGWMFGVPDLIKYRDDILNYCKECIEECERNLDPNNPQCLLDVYSKKMLDDQQAGIKDSTFTHRQIKHVIGDFFEAGSETTSTTLKFSILHLLRNPEVQTKMRKEIHEKVGSYRDVELSDKNNLPYTECVIMEILRISTIVPLGVPHTATANIKIANFIIPKGTIIMINQHEIQNSEEYFPEPEKFKPERFLNDDGTVNYKKEGFIAFSLGKRQCLGESLARAEIFLFLSNLVKKFNFKLPPGKPIPRSDIKKFGILVHPYEFELIAEQIVDDV